MRVTYDEEVDVLRITLNDEDIAESDEDKSGVIIDYDGQGNVVGLEVLDASTRVANPRTLEYSYAHWQEFLDDLSDLQEIDRVRNSGEEIIPWEQAKEDLRGQGVDV